MDIEVINLVRNTLESIEVKGRANLEAMLGCMAALDDVLAKAETEDVIKEAKTDG